MFFWGVFWHEQLIKFFLASTCDFSSPPSLPITLNSHLNQAISTLYPRPRSSFSEISISNSRFFSFSGRGTLHHTSILSTYTYNPILQYAEKRERARRGKKKKRKKENELPRVCRIRTKTYTHTHTYLLRTYLIASSTPPSVFKRV